MFKPKSTFRIHFFSILMMILCSDLAHALSLHSYAQVTYDVINWRIEILTLRMPRMDATQKVVMEAELQDLRQKLTQARNLMAQTRDNRSDASQAEAAGSLDISRQILETGMVQDRGLMQLNPRPPDVARSFSEIDSNWTKMKKRYDELTADRTAVAGAGAQVQVAAAEAISPLGSVCTELIEKCEKETAEAKKECDVDENEEIKNTRSSLSSVGDMTSQMANMAAMGNANSGTTANGPSTGAAQTCGMMSNIAAGVNGGIAAYRMSCSSEFDSCKSACSDARTKLLSYRAQQANAASKAAAIQACGNVASINDALATRVEVNSTQCNRLSSRANEATTGMQNAAGNLLSGATRCIENTVPGGLDAYCQANPSMAVCAGLAANQAVDCGNPTIAASSPVCICRVNPFDSRCGTRNTQNKLATNGLIGGAPLNGGATSGGDINTGIDGSSGIEANLTPGQEVGGRKMSLPGVMGGDSLQADQGGGGGGRAPFDPFNGPKIFGKYSSGAGQGGNAYGKSGSGYGSGVYGKSIKGTGDSALRDFLPNGMQDPNRGLAGSVDGILGPNVNIWEKINNRYVDHSLTKQSLLPSNYQATPQELLQRKRGN